MAKHDKKDDQPTGLLPEDWEAIGETPPGEHNRSPRSPEGSPHVRAALDAAIPGTITDEDIETIAEFLRDKMNAAKYSLIFATQMKAGQERGSMTMQMMGGNPMECCFLMDLIQMTHQDRLRRIDKALPKDRGERTKTLDSLEWLLGRRQ